MTFQRRRPDLSVKKTAAAIGLAATVVLVGACGGDSGDAATSSEPMPTTASTSLGPASTELPGDFPKDVPVIAGTYQSQLSPLPSTYMLRVTDVTDGAFDDAVSKLKKAGFKPHDGIPGSNQGELRTGTFSNAQRLVTVIAAPVEGKPTLTYSVSPLPR